MRKICFLILSLLLFTALDLEAGCSWEYLIGISTQEQFDHLEKSIIDAVAEGKKKIKVRLAPGNYAFSGSHLRLEKADASLDISIEGNGAVLYPKGVSNPSSVNPGYIYLDAETLEPVDLWSSKYAIDGIVDVVDKGSKTCRVKLPARMDVKTGDWIQISRWYTSSTHLISKVKEGYAYFVVEDLSYSISRLSYNINLDKSYGKQSPRFRILAASAIKGRKLIECRETNFINVESRRIGSFRMEGISFRGCAYTNWKGLIRFNGVRSDGITIKGCDFRGCRSVIMNINASNDFLCSDCVFEDGKLLLGGASLKRLKKSTVYKEMKEFFK